MKRFFTLLAGLLVAGTFVSQAEEVIASFYAESGDDFVKYAEDETMNVVKNDDGSYTIENFLNSGEPVSFTLDCPKVDDYGEITITSPLYEYPYNYKGVTYYFYYFLNKDEDDFISIKLTLDGEEDPSEIEEVEVDLDYNYVYRYDMSDEDNYYEYEVGLNLAGFIGDDPTGYFYVIFYLGAREDDSTGINSISTDNAAVKYFNLNGQQVENPSNGIFIRKQGNKVSKVVVR